MALGFFVYLQLINVNPSGSRGLGKAHRLGTYFVRSEQNRHSPSVTKQRIRNFELYFKNLGILTKILKGMYPCLNVDVIMNTLPNIFFYFI